MEHEPEPTTLPVLGELAEAVQAFVPADADGLVCDEDGLCRLPGEARPADVPDTGR